LSPRPRANITTPVKMAAPLTNRAHGMGPSNLESQRKVQESKSSDSKMDPDAERSGFKTLPDQASDNATMPIRVEPAMADENPWMEVLSDVDNKII